MMEPRRFEKNHARCGGASRRASEGLILAGRVEVNGAVVRELGTKVDPAVDVVSLDGEEVRLPRATVVLMLNKPAGYLSAMSDPHGGRCVSKLVPTDRFAGLFPVGRLDKDTTGLLLFTNDGELGNALIHPRHHVPKTYRAWVKGSPGSKAIETLRKGVMLEDGITQPAKVDIVKREAGRTLLELTIFEGRNRQIRRMGEAVGHPVERLKRIALGPLSLAGLKTGAWRESSPEEHAALLAVTDLSRDRMVERIDE